MNQQAAHAEDNVARSVDGAGNQLSVEKMLSKTERNIKNSHKLAKKRQDQPYVQPKWLTASKNHVTIRPHTEWILLYIFEM